MTDSREIVGTCRFCGSPLYVSDLDEYEYQCFECDEDFYGFEQELPPIKKSDCKED